MIELSQVQQQWGQNNNILFGDTTGKRLLNVFLNVHYPIVMLLRKQTLFITARNEVAVR